MDDCDPFLPGATHDDPIVKHDAGVVLPKAHGPPPRHQPRVIAIGASTGGTEALAAIFNDLPPRLPPIAVVQHMPEGFIQGFASRLNLGSAIEVFEAEQGRVILPGQAAIARGDRHMVLVRDVGGYRIDLLDGPRVSRHRPSVDVLFRSVAQTVGASAIGVLLTGMGDDGARGLLEMRQAGARTLAQNAQTCVVYGMPRVAVELGAATTVLPLGRIASEIVDWARAGARQPIP
ncbi:CheB methylesterase domain-containing protein [Maritimibacter sp. DP1N21-5]|uniref:CheB methylesterase domain-containing protein n=1 Tax=Maritimibacter sp. DP1N21-5 TaxID=2836867 RepID=UPI001C43764F|nr:CheB methylesterase domain-containing protein [Maritimibacter sp. DP1N21-5]MBV7410776.1 chemotaxis protein CheB [Maritimibacter sp. DP1N21-5]